MKDRALRGSPEVGCRSARKAAPEQDAGRLGQHANVVTHRTPQDLEHGGLTGARAAGEHDPAREVRAGASTSGHDVIASPDRTSRTGHGAVRATDSATLPSTSRDTPRLPCVPITIRSGWSSSANARIAVRASPFLSIAEPSPGVTVCAATS